MLPLYGELAHTDEGRALALEIYREARPIYHVRLRGILDQRLGWKPPPAPDR